MMDKHTTVLIADSSEAFCSALVAALHRQGSFRVIGTATDGEQAAKLVTAQRPDMLVLDLMLPKQDGIGVLKSVAGKCAVLATTNFVSSFVSNTVAGLGVQYLMQKPCDIDELVERMGEIRDEDMRYRAGCFTDKAGIEGTVTAILQQIGIPAHAKGFLYLRAGILMAVKDREVLSGITKLLYPQVGKDYHTNPNCVERSMRRAIEVAWARGDLDTLRHFFGHTVSSTKGKPTNSEFIALIAERIRLQQKGERVSNY